MPNKIKLNLEDLKVESFITELKEEEKNYIRGGESRWDENCTRGTSHIFDEVEPI